MKTFCHLIGKYFGIIAVVFLILGMTVPDSFKWVVGNIGGIPVLSTLLGVIMFGMGTTLNLRDFALVLKRPVDVFVGVCAQYLIMPSLAFLLAMAFNLDPALTAGVVLVGTCPGGTSSNVITFMSKGDLALSVTMTSVSTLLSPILTPLITYQLIGQKIAFDPVNVIYGDRKQTQLRVYPHILLHLCCDLSGGISQLSHAGLAQYPFHACFFLPATEDIDNIADQLRREHVHGVGKFSIARPRHYLDVMEWYFPAEKI